MLERPSSFPEGTNESMEYNIRYLGFESLPDAGRRFDYVLTSRGKPSRRVSVEIPGSAFVGPSRITFQESAAIGYEKVRREIAAETEVEEDRHFVLDAREIEEISPRRRAAPKSHES